MANEYGLYVLDETTNTWVSAVADPTVVNALQVTLNNHTANKQNPHSVTKEQVGLGNVDNTKDADKPISTAVQQALSGTAKANDLIPIYQEIDAVETKVTEHLDQYATKQNMTINVLTSQSLHQVLNELPMRIDHVVTVNVAPGTYDEDVYFEGRVGRGRLIVNGASNVASTHKVRQLLFINDTIPITTTGIETLSLNSAGFYVENCTNVVLDKCKCVQSSTSQNAITFVFSKGTVQGCQLSNRAMAIYSGNSSTVTSSGNTGTGNQLGLVAEFASVIGKAGAQPDATTTEFVQNGGEIR